MAKSRYDDLLADYQKRKQSYQGKETTPGASGSEDYLAYYRQRKQEMAGQYNQRQFETQNRGLLNAEKLFEQYDRMFDRTQGIYDSYQSGKFLSADELKKYQAEMYGAQARTLWERRNSQGDLSKWYEELAGSYGQGIKDIDELRGYYGNFKDAGDYARKKILADAQQAPDKMDYKWWEEALRTPGSQAQTYEDMQEKQEDREYKAPDPYMQPNKYTKDRKPGELLPGEVPPYEPGSALPEGTRRIASTGASDVNFKDVFTNPNDKPVNDIPDSIIHPDLRGLSLQLDPQKRTLDKQISYLEELRRWQAGQVTQPDLQKMADEKLLPGMGKYKLEGMGGAEIKGILETEKNKLASGNGNPHMVQGIKDYYYNNTSQGTRDYIAEITPRVAELNAELERLRYAEVDIIYKMDSGSMAGQEGVEAIYANSERLAQVTTELERLSTLANVILPIQETYLRLNEENAELRKDPDFLAKTFFEPEKGYDAILAKALDETGAYDQMEWRNKLPLSTAEYIYQSIAGKMQADPNTLGYDNSKATGDEGNYTIGYDETGALVLADPSGQGNDDPYARYEENYGQAARNAAVEGRGLDKLTPDEKHTFMYKYNVQGPAQAMAYLDDLGDVLLYRRAIDNEEAWRAYAGKNGWTATLATVASVPLNMANAAMMPLRMAHAATGGSPFDRVMDTQRMTNVYREEGAKMLGGAIDFVIPGINKNAGELIYGVATSMADMWAAAGVGAMVGAPNAVSFILGSSAASATLLSAMESGKNPGQAVAQSFLAGAIEVATEAISWSKLKKLGYSAKKSMMQNVARNIAVQAATEGMEEGFSAVGNMAVSVLMYGLERSDFGDLQKAVQADALKAGETLTEDQVFTRALLRFAQDMGGDILAGMMSGGLNAAGMMAFSQEHRSDLVGRYLNDQIGIINETAAKVDQYGGEQVRDAERAVEQKIWGRPVGEMTLEERWAEMDEIEKRLKKGASTMTTQEQVETSRRLNELTDYSTLPGQQTETRGEERAEEAQLPPQIETREERMAKVEELSRYEAENTERLTPQEKRQIAQQKEALMADVDTLPTMKQANIQAQQALGARLDAALAAAQEARRGRIAAEAKLGRVKQNVVGSQLARSAKLDAEIQEAYALQQRMADLQAVPPEQMETPEVLKELRDIAAEMRRMAPQASAIDTTQSAIQQQQAIQTQLDAVIATAEDGARAQDAQGGPEVSSLRGILSLQERMNALMAENRPDAIQELQGISQELGKLSPKRIRELRDIDAEYGQRPQLDAVEEPGRRPDAFVREARDMDAERGQREQQLQTAAEELGRQLPEFIKVLGDTDAEIGPQLQATADEVARRLPEFIKALGDTDAEIGPQQQAIVEELGRQLPEFIKALGDVDAEIGAQVRGAAEELGRQLPEYIKVLGDTAAELGPRAEAPTGRPPAQVFVQYQQAIQASLDAAIAEATAAVEKAAREGQERQNDIGSQLDEGAELDADVAEAQEAPDDDDAGLHAFRLLQERMDAIRALPEDEIGTPEVRQELQDIAAEMDRLEPANNYATPKQRALLRDMQAEAKAKGQPLPSIERKPITGAIERHQYIKQSTLDAGVKVVQARINTEVQELEVINGQMAEALRIKDDAQREKTIESLRARYDTVSKRIDRLGKQARDIQNWQPGPVKPMRQNPRGVGGVLNKFDSKVMKRLSGRLKDSLAALNMIGKALDQTFEVYENLEVVGPDGRKTAAYGEYDPKTGRIKLSLNTLNQGLLTKAAHEMTHRLRVENPEAYLKLLEMVQDAYADKGASFDDAVAHRYKQYTGAVEGFTIDQAVEEVIANSTEEFLGDTAQIRRLADENPGFLKRVIDYIGTMISKIEKAFKGLKSDTREAQFIREYAQDFRQKHQEMSKVYWDALARKEGQDSEGRLTTENMAASPRYSLAEDIKSDAFASWFRDSKVVDDKGNPLVVYHGSPNDFNIFDYSKLRTNGSTEGVGFYFTDNRQIAEGYAEKGKPGKLFETYLSIQKPISETKKNITRAEFRKFLDAFNKYEADNEDGMMYYLSNWGDYEREGYNRVLTQAVNAEYEGSGNDLDLISSIINASGDPASVYKVLRDTLGYDGVITKWEGDDGPPTNIYVAFNPNQIKSATANIGTYDPANPDIRYSLADDAYMEAVQAGDMDTAQRMVDEAAKAAGYNIRAYHGTKNSFTVFDRDKIGSETDSGWFGEGFYFHVDEDTANIYGGFNGRVIDAYLKLGKTWDINKLIEPEGKTIGDVIDDAIGKDPYPSLGHRDPRSEQETARLITEYLNNNGYDSVRVWGQVMVMNPEQIKSADPVTYDDAGNIIPLSERFNAANPDIRYSLEDTGPSPALTDALEGLPSAGDAGNILDSVFNAAKGFRLTDRQIQLIAERIIERTGSNVPVDEIAPNLKAAFDYLANGRNIEWEKVMSFVQQTMADIVDWGQTEEGLTRNETAFQLAADMFLTQYRNKIRAPMLEQYRMQLSTLKQEMRMGYRQRDERVKYLKQIDSKANTLLKWLARPDAKKHVPEQLRTSVFDLLRSLDMAWTRDGEEVTSWRSRSWQEAIQAVSRQMQGADLVAATMDGESTGSFVMTLDPDLVANINELTREADGVIRYRDMKPEQLAKLSAILQNMTHAITSANRFHSDQRYADLSTLANKSIDQLRSMREKKLRNKAVERISNALNIDMADAFTFFDSLGAEAKVVLKALYKGGFGRLVENTKVAQDFFEELNKKYKQFGIAKWSGKDAPAQTFDVTGGQLTMTPGQVMELYLLNKREQARGHIYGKGIRVESTKARQDGKRTNLQQADPVQVTEADVDNILSTLTDEQRQAAEDFANFLAETSTKWGNEVSMILYGYNKFTEMNYYPIRSDQDFTLTKDPSSMDNLYALLNLGMTKATVAGANNAILVGDVFDTITRHITDMANYNAFAVPLTDAMKWYNFKRETADEQGNVRVESVKSAIKRAHGQAAQGYFVNLMKAINGIKNPQTAQGFQGMINTALSKFKRSAVAGNVRVILQQHASIARASLMLSPVDIARAYTRSPRRGMQMAQKYSHIAAWKAMGYYDMNIGRSMTDLISGRVGAVDKFTDKTMKPAGAMDNFTLGVLWNAVELEVGRTYEGAKDSEEFYRLVGDRLTDIIDRTQVVDTVFHRSQAMRDKDGLMKMSTNFMSEPIKGYNMLMNALRSHDPATIARAGVVHVANALLVAFMAGLWDPFRDDEKKKGLPGYVESVLKHSFGIGGKFFESNVWDNLNPLNMIPIAKEVQSVVFDGYSPSRPDLQAIQRVKWAADDWLKVARGEYNGSIYKLAYKTLSAVSTTTGIPLGNLMRDANAIITTLNPQVVVGDGGVPASLAYERFATALEQGNEQEAFEYYSAIIKSGKTPSAVTTGLSGQLKTNDIVMNAAEAKRAGDNAAYEAYVREAVDSGYPRDIVIRTVNSLLSEKPEKEATELPENYEEMLGQLGYSANTYSYNTDDLVRLYDAGNRQEASRVLRVLVQEGKKESAVLSDVRGAYRDQYAAGAITRATAASKLKMLNPQITSKDTYKMLRSWDYARQYGTMDGYSVFNDFYRAVETGAGLKTVLAEYTDAKRLGYEKSDLAFQITTHFKPQYIAATKAQRARMKGYLLNAYALLGYDRTKKGRDIDAWLK